MKIRPYVRLRTILLLVYLFVIIIPLGSVYFFRLFENELVRQTESELLIHAAYISSAYKQALLPLMRDTSNYGIPAKYTLTLRDGKYTAITPVIDLHKSTVLPSRSEAKASVEADYRALQAGKSVMPLIEDAVRATLAGVRITDYHGVVVAGREEVGMSLAHVEEVAAALQGKYAADLRVRASEHEEPPLSSLSRGSHIRVFIALPITYNDRVIGTVLLSRSPRNIMKGLYDNRNSLITSGLIVLGLTILSALLTSYAISRPVYALIQQTQRIAHGERNIGKIDNPVTQEMALLSQNIADMAQTIAERSDYIRNFAMHVSHEFKTPLTAIQGAIELIQEHGNSMPPEQFSRFLSNIMKDAERLKKLVSRLLELARADVTQPRQESCKLSALTQSLQSYYRGREGSISIQNEDNITLPMPGDIADTILTNLVENSFQHEATTIIIHGVRTQDGIRITVSDNGRGISAANAEKLFTPFFTTKRELGGTGLGLVIIRSLLSAYGAEVKCIPQETGACFEITWMEKHDA